MTCTIISTGEELLVENKNESEPPYPMIKAKLRELIWGLYCQGYDSFYVNCEYGIPLWAEEFRERYFSVHEKADNVTMASTQYHPDCYSEAEQMMVDKSDLLIICGKCNVLSPPKKYTEYKELEVFCFLEI